MHKMRELPLVTLPHPIAGRKREEVDEMSERASTHLAAALTRTNG
jgi:predicted dienelactone hydrolase